MRNILISSVSLRWFDRYPELKQVFHVAEYESIEDIVRSPNLLEHMVRIKGVFQHLIDSIFIDENFDQFLLDLGKKHYKFGAQQKYAQVRVDNFSVKNYF